MKKITLFVLIAAALFIVSGCDLGLFSNNGTLSINMVDAPLTIDGATVTSINVTVKSVEVSMGTGGSELMADTTGETVDPASDGDAEWITLTDTPAEYDLLKLQNDVSALIGQSDLKEGKYNQIRLILDTENTITFEGDETLHPLRIPSSTTSGVKITGTFNVVEGEETSITLDFDAQNSVHLSGIDWILNPVVKVQKVGNGGPVTP